jgi:hypothetical protein
MPRLFLHRDVEDYFTTFDCSTTDAEVASVVKPYELGKVIVLRHTGLDYDRGFIGGLELPAGVEAFKKFKSVRFLDEYFGRNSVPAELLERCFAGDRGRLRYFAEQVRSINTQVMDLARRLFPHYRLITSAITWRMTETLNENLHFDVYKEDLPDHHLRMFVNLDLVPRIWHTSFTLEHALRNYLSTLDRRFVATATAGRICHDLNFAVFGGFESAGREGRPKHISFFDPAEVWLVDSRKISHQIFYGRRALSTDFAVEVASMDDPGTHYYTLVERHRSALLSGATTSGRGACFDAAAESPA